MVAGAGEEVLSLEGSAPLEAAVRVVDALRLSLLALRLSLDALRLSLDAVRLSLDALRLSLMAFLLAAWAAGLPGDGLKPLKLTSSAAAAVLVAADCIECRPME